MKWGIGASSSRADDWERSWKGAFYKSDNPAAERACFERANYIAHCLGTLNFQPHRILDLGCGNGMVIKFLLSRYPDAEAFLVDWSEEALRLAKTTLASLGNRTTFVQGNSNHVSSYEHLAPDLILSMGVIEHFPSPGELVADIARIQSPDALLILMTPNRRSFVRVSRLVLQLVGRWTIGFQKEYSVRDLAAFCEAAGLATLHAEALNRVYIPDDTPLTKLCSFADRLISVVTHDWGWYSFVFAKGTNAPHRAGAYPDMFGRDLESAGAGAANRTDS